MKKIEVLVLDDNSTYHDMIKESLSPKEFRLTPVYTSGEVLDALERKAFDVCLVDVQLGPDNGIDVGRVIREMDPRMVVILMTAGSENLRNVAPGFDDYIVKGMSPDSLGYVIQNALYRKRMPRATRVWREQLFRDLLPYCPDTVRDFRRVLDGVDYVEKPVGTWALDGRPASWVVYEPPGRRKRGNKKRIVKIGTSSTVGCGRRCQFCRSGTRRCVRPLDSLEILAQALYALDGFLARGAYELPQQVEVTVNSTCEGEPLANGINVLTAYNRLAKTGLISRFIITSMCLEHELRAFLELFRRPEYAELRRITTIYWSLTSPIQSIREVLMPATVGQDLVAIRDLLQEFAEETGNPVTISIIVIPGMTNRPEDVRAIAELFGEGRPFRIMLKAYKQPRHGQRFAIASQQELEELHASLVRHGLDSRIRQVFGEYHTGCGANAPGEEL